MSEENKAEDKPESGRTIAQSDYDNAVHRARTFEGKLVDFEKKFEKIGGVDKALELLANANKAPEPEKIDVESIRKSLEADVRKSVQADLDTLASERDLTKKELHELRVVDKISDEWSGQFLQSALPLIKEMYIKRYIDKDSEGFLVKDDEGKIRFKGAVRMTPQDFLNEVTDRHPDLIRAEKAKGVLPKGETKSVSSERAFQIPAGMNQAELTQYFANQKRQSMQAR